MSPTVHPSNNAVMRPPAGAEAFCDSIAVTRATMDGRVVLISYWKPDIEELQRLNAGELVAVMFHGEVFPMTSVFVDAGAVKHGTTQ